MTRHTPYDGSAPPFTFGLFPIALGDWIEVDQRLEEYLSEKDRLWREVPERVFVAEEGSEDAQAEVLELLLEHLPREFPQVYRRVGDVLAVGASRRVPVTSAGSAPLRRAASCVQEDLIVMRKAQAGWRLIAGSLSFPSSWHLREKFGKAMPGIHAPVPGFGEGSRNISLIERMFDHLRVEHVFARFNWGLYDGPQLHHPAAGNGMRRFGSDGDTRNVYLRVERQTLRRLPRTRDILFTIRTHLDPWDMLRSHPRRAHLSRQMHRQISALSAEQLNYKGLSAERQRLLDQLESLSAGPVA